MQTDFNMMWQTRGCFPWWSRRSVKLTTNFHSMPKLRMSGSLLPLPTHTFISCTETILLFCRIPNVKEIKNPVFCLCATVQTTVFPIFSTLYKEEGLKGLAGNAVINLGQKITEIRLHSAGDNNWTSKKNHSWSNTMYKKKLSRKF